MKNIIIIILASVCYLKASSQTTFEYLYRSPMDETSSSIVEDEEGNLYFPVLNFINSKIIKLDNDGNFLDSISIYNPGGTCNLEALIKTDTNHIVAIGNWKIDTVSYLWYVKLDEELNIQSDIKINSYSNYLTDFQHIINFKGNIVLSASYFLPNYGYPDVCMYEIEVDGSLIRDVFFNTPPILTIATSIIENNYDSTYKIISTGPMESGLQRLACILNRVDTNFNVLDSYGIQNANIETRASAKWLNDSYYLLAGRWYVTEEEEVDIGILKVDRNDSVLLSASFGKADTVEWPGNYNCIDFISPENIFFAGATNCYQLYQHAPSWIMLNILDSSLNLKEQQYYGGDAFYTVNTVLATKDSGCVMVCSRYDYLVQDNEYDVYILKVNKEGLLVSTPETPEISRQLCTVYPNPGSEMVNVNSIKGELQFQLIDLTGKLQLATALGKGNNLLDASGLAAGIYLYRIMDNENQTVQTGKWLRAY